MSEKPRYLNSSMKNIDVGRSKINHKSMADPGFPRGGGANFLWGRQDTILLKFPVNGMKLKKIRPSGGGGSPAPPYIRSS